MDTKVVGETAGRIWQHLAKAGPTLVKDLAKATGINRDLALMALGWLGREEKVMFEEKGKDLLVTLTEEELKNVRPT